jgi:hypothetical protein
MAITAGYGNAKFVDDAQVCDLFFIFFFSFRPPKERERDRDSRILIDFFPAGLSLSLCPIIKFPRRVYDARERSFPALGSRKRETTT